tara:strand:- start:6913 stop:7284 length:372 start_codon:yes stop_codon:yes gene_type:complete
VQSKEMEIKFFNKQTLLSANVEALIAANVTDSKHGLWNGKKPYNKNYAKVNYIPQEKIHDIEEGLMMPVIKVQPKDAQTVTVTVLIPLGAGDDVLTEHEEYLLDLNTTTFENLPIVVMGKLDS